MFLLLFSKLKVVFGYTLSFCAIIFFVRLVIGGANNRAKLENLSIFLMITRYNERI